MIAVDRLRRRVELLRRCGVGVGGGGGAGVVVRAVDFRLRRRVELLRRAVDVDFLPLTLDCARDFRRGGAAGVLVVDLVDFRRPRAALFRFRDLRPDRLRER